MSVDPTEDKLDRAYRDGQRQAEMTAQLSAHERRLNAINGSIERGAQANANVVRELQELKQNLHTSLSKIVSKREADDAVQAALSKQIKNALEQQISSRTFLIGVGLVCVGLLSVVIAVLTAVHAL